MACFDKQTIERSFFGNISGLIILIFFVNYFCLPNKIFKLASWFWPTIAYCLLFNIGAILLKPDQFNNSNKPPCFYLVGFLILFQTLLLNCKKLKFLSFKMHIKTVDDRKFDKNGLETFYYLLKS